MPPTAPGPGRVTVAELARELGIEAAPVLAELRRIGVEAVDAAAEIPDEAVFAVWPRLAGSGDRPAVPATGPEPRSAPPPRAPSAGVLEAFTSDVVGRWPLRRSEAAGVAQRWLGLQIDLATARRFWASGLGPYDHQLAAEWMRYGLTPEDLLRQVGGRSAGRRLRGGEPLASISMALGPRGSSAP